MDLVKKFSINDIELFKEDNDVDFAHVKIWALAEGNNSHKNPISLEILKRDANTILGKLIIGKFEKYENDTTTHVPDQTILGYIPKEQEVKFEEKNGKTFITVEGLISKLYATDVVQMFKDINFRSVSCEFSCKEGEEDEFGNKPILSFSIHGVTILGLKYSPSCKGAEIKVMQFAEKENSLNLKLFAQKRKKEFELKESKEEKMADKEKKVTAEEKVEETENKEKEMAEQEEEKKEDKPSNSEEDTKKKMSEEKDDEEDDDDKDEKEKKMSTDSNVDTMASLAFLENETEQYKEMINKMYAQDKEIIMEEYLKMAKERDELKTYQENRMKEDKEFAVNKIMADVKEDLDEKEFEDLKKEGMACKYEDVKGFENKVKAFAYEKSKSNPKKKESNEDIMKFEAKNVKEEKSTEETVDDIYNKYL